jgi:hypothetical protein
VNIWTAADDAELDVLLHALTVDYAKHRDNCDACQPCPYYEAWLEHKARCKACKGIAPLTYGPPCEKPHDAWTCLRCNPCPHLTGAINEVAEWFEARKLRSRAEALRAARTAELERAA